MVWQMEEHPGSSKKKKNEVNFARLQGIWKMSDCVEERNVFDWRKSRRKKKQNHTGLL